MLRVMMWVFAFGLVSVAVIPFWSAHANKQWKEAQRAYIAGGETLEFEKLLPGPIDEAENFCAIPELRDIAVIIDGDRAKGNPAKVRENLEAMTWNKDQAILREPGYADASETGMSTDVAKWEAFLREKKLLKFEANSRNPGADIVLAIDRTFPLAVTIAAHSTRKFSQFTPAPSIRDWKRPMYDQQYAWIGSTFALTKMFHLRAEAAAVARDAKSSRESVSVMRHLATAAYQEPHLIGRLIALAMDARFRRALWATLKSKCLSEADLERLQAQMQGGRSIESLLYTLRTEMCFQVETHDFLRGPGRDKLGGPMPLEPMMPLWVARVLPDGWIDHNGVVGFEMEATNKIAALRDQGLPGLISGIAKQQAELSRLKSHFVSRMSLAMLLIDSPVQVMQAKCCVAIALDQQAVAAIALERFYLRHQAYPEKLEEIVPELLSAVPLDRMTGKPLGYRRTTDGRYMLWSVGFDGVDDGGKVPVDLTSGGTASLLYSLDYKGDWVWQYTPVHP